MCSQSEWENFKNFQASPCRWKMYEFSFWNAVIGAAASAAENSLSVSVCLCLVFAVVVVCGCSGVWPNHHTYIVRIYIKYIYISPIYSTTTRTCNANCSERMNQLIHIIKFWKIREISKNIAPPHIRVHLGREMRRTCKSALVTGQSI